MRKEARGKVDERTARFLKKLFASYYAKRGPKEPRDLPHREFAFMTFGEKMVIRHKGFRSYGELRDFMANLGPSDAFYSSAYFAKPDEPDMKAKGWLGADLIFDIDADHLPTSCREEHDRWACPSCGYSGRGEAPEKCPKCSSDKLLEVKWICDKCLSAAKDELIRLIEVLEGELGLRASDMIASFSGHRGYHLQVCSKAVLGLGQDERGEIVDYLLAIGLDPEALGLIPGAKLDMSEPGWRGRLARALYAILCRADEVELRSLGLRPKAVRALLASRDIVLDCLEHGRPLYLPRGFGRASLKKLLVACAEREAIKVDPVVTRDTHRLVRMSGALHGKTGLLKVDVPLDGLEGFDPLSSAVAFGKKPIRVKIAEGIPEVPAIRLGDEAYGPFEPGEFVVVPLCVAIFLMCKGVASLA